jgi:guanine deaminase
MTATIVRAQILHTPRDPFHDGAAAALEAFSDGGLAYGDDGRVLRTGPFADVRAAHPDAKLVDASDAILIPGLVDLHVHYPQIAVIGAMGMTLLEWLATRTLPEEARLADTAYATEVARAFVRGLARNGTTAALVFGSHFAGAQEALFAEAELEVRRAASSSTAAAGCATRSRRASRCRAPTR